MKSKIFLLLAAVITFTGCNQKKEATHVEEVKEEPRVFNMIYVEGGTFTMGHKEESFNNPRHTVEINSFYISDIEVTQHLFKEIMGYITVKEKIEEFINNPVVYINWMEAVEFCNRLSERDGFALCYKINGNDVICDFSAGGYRLPTEAEWEYAARGGKYTHNYMFSGSNRSIDVAWVPESFPDDIFPHLMEVGLKNPNELGLYDMTGNAAEWCWDWYEYDYYLKAPSKNPKGPNNYKNFPGYEEGIEFGKLLRGGDYRLCDICCPIYERDYENFNNQYFCTGFRIVRSAVEE